MSFGLVLILTMPLFLVVSEFIVAYVRQKKETAAE